MTIRLMPDTALCGHIITRRYQPTLFITHSNLEKNKKTKKNKNSATIIGPRSGQTQSWPSPKQGRLCLGPCLHEVPQREGKVEGRKERCKEGWRPGRKDGRKHSVVFNTAASLLLLTLLYSSLNQD